MLHIYLEYAIVCVHCLSLGLCELSHSLIKYSLERPGCPTELHLVYSVDGIILIRLEGHSGCLVHWRPW